MITFYNPQSSAGRKPISPLSLLAVGAVLEGDHNYRILDGNLEADPLARLDEAIRADPSPRPLLAMTVMPGPQLRQAVPLCRELKRRHPKLTLVWGGYFPTQHWEACLRDGLVDYVVRGHGEYVFKQLLDHLHTGLPLLADIPGLAYLAPDGVPASNPLAPLPHPARLPDFNFDRVPVERYVRRTYLGTRTLGYHSSYGCPFFCNFCAVVNLVNGKWLPQTADQVVRALEQYARRWQINGVEFYDNNFFVHEARTAEIAERIRPLKLGWWGEARIDTLLKFSDRTWALMRDAGLKMVFMGAESGSLETLQRMDKGGTMSPDKTLAIAGKMQAYGIVPEFSFVLGSPPDPEADVRQTLEFVRRVKRVNPASEIVLYNYTPVPLAGDLYDTAQAQGFRFPETLEEWVSDDWLDFAQRHSAHMPWLPDRVRRHIRNFERVLNAYYPTSTDLRLTGLRRHLLRAASGWRYWGRFYHLPLELSALQRVMHYQRPETSGF
jgi:radical SAM superfamily enzyme YgiQ (UPF0313 family)